MISLVYLTYRPGGIDLLATSFAKDEKRDYELIVIDDFPGRAGRGEAQKFLVDQGIKLGYYGGSKNKSYPNTKCGLANTVNTALIQAKGDFIVFLSDYSMLTIQWLEHWIILRGNINKKLSKNDKWLCSGGGIVYDTPKPLAPRDVLTWGKNNVPSPVPKWPWVPKEFETFYYGGPLAFFLTINGVDERSDHCISWSLESVVAQAKILEYDLIVEPQIVAHIIDHRVWDHKAEPSPWGIDGMWRIADSRSLQNYPEWVVPSPNPFNLVEERKKIHG